MADSWEDQAEVAPAGQPAAPPKPAAPSKLSLNPNASSFSFNPTASTFNPSSSFTPAKPSGTQPAAQPVATSAHPVTTSHQPSAAPTENGTASTSADTHMTDAAELPSSSGKAYIDLLQLTKIQQCTACLCQYFQTASLCMHEGQTPQDVGHTSCQQPLQCRHGWNVQIW